MGATEDRENDMTCKPQVPAVKLPADPCARLELIEAALYEHAAGKTRGQVRHGEHWVTYHPGSVTFLERERARLQALCNKRHGFSVGRSNGGFYPPIPWRYR